MPIMKGLESTKMWPRVHVIVHLIFLLYPSRCFGDPSTVNYLVAEKQVLDKILDETKYDARIRPYGENVTDGPAIVRINVIIRSIDSINDHNMDFSVQLTIRQQWLDERLLFDDLGGRLKYLTLRETLRVWTPDLFFANEKQGRSHNIITPNLFIRIFPNGHVLYSTRISLTLSCPMDFRLYPFDRQVCSFRIADYALSTNDVILLWKEGDPVQVVNNIPLPRYILEKFSADYCSSKSMPEEYSCLKINLFLKRDLSYYVIQIFIPCWMLVVVSWIPFWLDESAVTARVSLGATTVLTMAIQACGIGDLLPPVSYTKAIDVWTGVCLTFVLCGLFEFALVNYSAREDIRRETIKMKYRGMGQSSVNQVTEILESDNGTKIQMKPLVPHQDHKISTDSIGQCQTPKKNCWRSWLSKFPKQSKRIDIVARVISPIMFALFNLAYWFQYSFREEDIY